jgi:hypothetical protein
MTATGRKQCQLVGDLCFLGFLYFTTIAPTIIKKYNRALANELESRIYFKDLSTVPTAEEMQKWETEISEAEIMRTRHPEAMDVMAPQIPKGKFVHSSTIFILPTSVFSTNIG